MIKISNIREKMKNSAMKGKNYLTNGQIINNICNVMKKSVGHGKGAIDSSSRSINYVVATDAVRQLEQFLGHTFNEGIPSIYDKAMDAIYNATHIGGGNLHRLFDGSHTIWAAWEKCKNALPDDMFAQEVVGYFKALGHDLSSSVGLPIADITIDGYEKLVSWMKNFDVTSSWTQDLLHINVPELLGSTIGSLAIVFNWNSNDITKFSDLVAELGLSSIAAANPLGVVITLVGLARSYQLVTRRNARIEALNGFVRGGLRSSVFITTSAVIGGPVWIGLVSAIVIYFITHKHIDKINIQEIQTAFLDIWIKISNNSFDVINR